MLGRSDPPYGPPYVAAAIARVNWGFYRQEGHQTFTRIAAFRIMSNDTRTIRTILSTGACFRSCMRKYIKPEIKMNATTVRKVDIRESHNPIPVALIAEKEKSATTITTHQDLRIGVTSRRSIG
jgi:hypothetical protein